MGARTFVRAIAVALVAAVALYFWNHRSGQLLNLSESESSPLETGKTASVPEVLSKDQHIHEESGCFCQILTPAALLRAMGTGRIPVSTATIIEVNVIPGCTCRCHRWCRCIGIGHIDGG